MNDLSSTAKPVVGILRLQLFKPSETFIPAQVRHMRRYAPIFAGRRLFGPAPYPAKLALAPSRLDAVRLIVLRDTSPLDRAMGEDRPRLLHAHFGVDGVYGLALSRRLGVPLITTLHGFDVMTFDAAMLKSGRPPLIHYVLRRKRLQRSGALFVCVSDFIRKAALAKGFPSERTIRHYIGIDTAAISRRTDAGDDDLILHVGRLVEKKGARYLIDAVAKLREAGRIARLVIIGEGPLRGDLQRQAESAGLGCSVQFLGALPHADVLAWMRRAAVLALPSVVAENGDAEGFGIVILEAAALGVPVIASNSGGIPEAVLDGVSGFLTPERDSGAIAARLQQLLDDPRQRIAIGESARARVEAEFDISRQTRKLEDLYDSVLLAHAERHAGRRPS